VQWNDGGLRAREVGKHEAGDEKKFGGFHQGILGGNVDLANVEDGCCLWGKIERNRVRGSGRWLAVTLEQARVPQAGQHSVVGSHRYASGLASFVDRNENVLRRAGRDQRTHKDEDIMIRVKNLLVPGLEGGMKSSEGKQISQRCERLLLLWTATCGAESVGLRPCESAREIVPVVGIFSTLHGEFIARVNLRHSAHRRENGERE
jgi:hypothetical protein